jgi:uncharacterized protein YmfQ (DUF2313 family)
MGCFWLEPKGKALEALLRHTPLGVAWEAFRIPGKVAYRLYEAYASALEDAWGALCRLAHEIDPRTTTDLIEEWERALSLPDTCLPEVVTIEERRQRVMFRLEKRRWTTAQDWHDLAAIFGLVITITPGWYVQKPALYAHCYPKRYDLFPKLGRFRVYIDVNNIEFKGYAYDYPFEYGLAVEAFSRFQCMIERVRPANVVVIWNQFPDTCKGGGSSWPSVPSSDLPIAL